MKKILLSLCLVFSLLMVACGSEKSTATFSELTIDNGKVMGEVTNNDKETKDITITITFKDTSGKIVDTLDTYAMGVGAGETKSFDSYTQKDISNCEYTIQTN